MLLIDDKDSKEKVIIKFVHAKLPIIHNTRMLRFHIASSLPNSIFYSSLKNGPSPSPSRHFSPGSISRRWDILRSDNARVDFSALQKGQEWNGCDGRANRATASGRVA